MPIRKTVFNLFMVMIALLLSAHPGPAQEETAAAAEKLMIWQLEALKNEDHQQFIEHGNKAFKELMDEHSFESLVMQRRAKLARGYKLEYFGAIRSIGMQKHLWRVNITGDKYQLLGSLSVSHGKVVGFDLE